MFSHLCKKKNIKASKQPFKTKMKNETQKNGVEIDHRFLALIHQKSLSDILFESSLFAWDVNLRPSEHIYVPEI